MKTISLLLLVVFLSGCASSGYKINYGTSTLNQENVNTIVKGKTTKQQVLDTFGNPLSKTSISSGEMWVYSRSTETATAKNFFSGTEYAVSAMGLSINFDENGIVNNYSVSEVNPVVPIQFSRF